MILIYSVVMVTCENVKLIFLHDKPLNRLCKINKRDVQIPQVFTMNGRIGGWKECLPDIVRNQ